MLWFIDPFQWWRRPVGRPDDRARARYHRSVCSRIAMLLVMSVISFATAFAQPVAITGGRVHPVSGPVIENGTVVITDGKITAVGAGVSVPSGATVIDAKGKWVTPGLINSATALGLVEVGGDQTTNDDTAKGERAVSAAFRAWEGLNPASVLWAPARNEGVTSVAVLPSGGLVAGQGAFVDTFGPTRTDMIRRAPAVMVANLGVPSAAEAGARGELFMRFRELLEDARVFTQRKDAFESGSTRAFAAGRLHLDALVPVIEGKLPMVATVDRAADIETALDLAQEYKLRLAILGGAEAWMVADRLAKARVPVITTGLDNIPTSFAALGARQENAGILQKAGVPVAIMAGEGETFNVRNIRQHAGNAVAYGLAWDAALRAVTLTPAEIYGLESSLGSLQVGKDANVVVWDGDPFEFSTSASHVFIRGRQVQGTSRQDLLTDRYKPKGR